MRMLHRPCGGGYDAMAVTLARILDERPDVSVVAICPDQVAVQASVRLTSVSIPAQEMGRHAVDRLVAKLDGRGTDEVVLIAPELTVGRVRGRHPPPPPDPTRVPTRHACGPRPIAPGEGHGPASP